jgi:ankyrin repeat protein
VSISERDKRPVLSAEASEQFGEALIARDARRLRELLDGGLPVNGIDKSTRQTLLLQSTGVGTTEIVNLLLDRGADISAVDKNGMGAVSRAAFTRRADLVELLVRRGAKVDQEDKLGQTPLFKAVTNREDSHDLVRLLIELGADPDASDSSGRSPRQMAEMLRSYHDYSDTIPPPRSSA